MEKIIELIKHDQTQGLEKATIVCRLVEAGWETDVINKAWEQVTSNSTPSGSVPSDSTSQQVISNDTTSTEDNPGTGWITLLNSLQLIMLYTAVGSFLTGAFGLIDLSFDEYFGRWQMETLKGAVATFVISFPTFLALSKLMHKLTDTFPKMWEHILRRVFGFITLFIIFLTVIWSLIAIVNELLDGAFLSQTMLKSIILIVMMIALFGYFWGELRSRHKANQQRAN